MNRKSFIRVGLGLVLALGAVPAFPQAGTVEAKVPFNFVVPGKAFSSGEYQMTIRPHELRIRDANGKLIAVVLANDSGRSAGDKGRIVFRCYRDRCFLAEVSAPGSEHGLEFPRSLHEMELGRQQSGVYFAVLGEKPRR